MTNDILETITEDYFRELGYFTQHNIPYKPKGIDVHSDIDVLAVDPKTSEVAVISCKSWQVNITEMLATLSSNPNKVIRGGTYTKRFREIADINSSLAIKEKIFELTGKNIFTFYLVVGSYKGDREEFENFSLFKENLPNCKIELITFKDIIEYFLAKEKTTTPSHSELYRIIQLMKASGGDVIYKEGVLQTSSKRYDASLLINS